MAAAGLPFDDVTKAGLMQGGAGPHLIHNDVNGDSWV